MRFRKFLKSYKTRGSSFREHTNAVGGVPLEKEKEKRTVAAFERGWTTGSVVGMCSVRNFVWCAAAFGK